MVIEAALPQRNRRILEKRAQPRDIALKIETRGVVGMDSGRRKNEAGILARVFSRERRGLQGLPDADDGRRARIAGAGDYRVAVAGERRIREVGVAVDEDRRASVLRGHLRSIQRSTGPAT